MKLHRIYAVVFHHFYILKSSPDRISDVFYWPTIDILVWGLTGVYFAKASSFPNVLVILLSGIIFWTLVYSGQREISLALLEELWNRNLINLFTSPLTYFEWIIGIIIVAIIKSGLSFSIAILLAIALYKINVFHYGLYLLPFIILLTMTAWSVGFVVAGLILRYTTRVQTLAWSMIAIISPFSGIYYSISILPDWAQKVALFIPTSYIFEGMREVILKGTLDVNKLYISFILNAIYFVLSLIYLKRSFNKTLTRGLVKLH